MKQELIAKLILNALDHYSDYLSNEGCNDLMAGHPLLKGITKVEKKEIEKAWIKLFPEESAECDNEMEMDGQLMETLIKTLK